MNPTRDKKVSPSALGLLIIGIVTVIPALLNIGNRPARRGRWPSRLSNP